MASRNKPPKQDLVDQVFGRLTAVEYLGRDMWSKHVWRCVCDCGRNTVATTRDLTTGHSKSCGCGRKTHGLSGSSTYQSWRSMWKRTTDANNVAHEAYKDFVPPPEWRDFAVFLAEVGLRPSTAYSLDRIDNTKGYTKDNVRWALSKEQGRNRDNNVYLEYRGERKLLLLFAEKYNLSPQTLYTRVFTHKWSVEDALTRPVQRIAPWKPSI